MDRFVLKDPLPYRTIAMVVAGLAGVVVILLGDLLSDDEDGSGSGGSDDGSGCAPRTSRPCQSVDWSALRPLLHLPGCRYSVRSTPLSLLPASPGGPQPLPGGPQEQSDAGQLHCAAEPDLLEHLLDGCPTRPEAARRKEN